MHRFVTLTLIFLLCPTTIFSSEGDEDKLFISCTKKCFAECSNGKDIEWANTADFWLKIFFWDCEQDCKYNCMLEITKSRERENKPVYKYYGKWPFLRILGLQELASSLFSIGNFVPFFYAYVYIIPHRIPSTYFLNPLLYIFALLGMAAWICSAIFHARDFRVTEILDYLFADCGYFFYSGLCVIRVFDLTSKKIWLLVYGIIVIFAVQHFSYLLLIKFDYGYNTLVGAIFSLFSGILTTAHAIITFNERRYNWKSILAFFAVFFAAAFEIFDFPPIMRIFDAHSLWHLFTIPVYFLIWSFIVDEADFYVNSTKEKCR